MTMLQDKILSYAKHFWFLGLTVLAALFFVFSFWFMTAGASREFLQKNEELSVLTVKRASLLQLKREHDSIDVLRNKLESTFVTQGNLVSFIEFMETVAKNTENSINISGVSTEGDVKDFKIILEGSYVRLVNFLAQLENSPYLARVIKLDSSEFTASAAPEVYLKTTLDVRVQSL